MSRRHFLFALLLAPFIRAWRVLSPPEPQIDIKLLVSRMVSRDIWSYYHVQWSKPAGVPGNGFLVPHDLAMYQLGFFFRNEMPIYKSAGRRRYERMMARRRAA
jgi:hypothetical protein